MIAKIYAANKKEAIDQLQMQGYDVEVNKVKTLQKSRPVKLFPFVPGKDGIYEIEYYKKTNDLIKERLKRLYG